VSVAARANQPTDVKRLEWLDAAKGFAIIMVVVGHVSALPWLVSAIFIWHMPFFFFVAGYTFRPNTDLRAHLKDKARRLLIPYAVYLMLFSLPDLVFAVKSGTPLAFGNFLFTRLMGGRLVYAWLVAVWFITVLFLTQIAVNYLADRYSRSQITFMVLSSLALAYAYSALLPALALPWDAQVCLMAFPLFYAGWRFRTQFDGRLEVLALALAVAALPAAAVGILRPFAMKNAAYGTPVISLVAALGISILVLGITRRLPQRWSAMRCLASVGGASLTVMYWHWPIQHLIQVLFRTDNFWIRTASGVALPYFLHSAFQRNLLTRTLLLGSPAQSKIS
jgi:fucose 4-O-acetylase-like acetyltransferase